MIRVCEIPMSRWYSNEKPWDRAPGASREQTTASASAAHYGIKAPEHSIRVAAPRERYSEHANAASRRLIRSSIGHAARRWGNPSAEARERGSTVAAWAG